MEKAWLAAALWSLALSAAGASPTAQVRPTSEPCGRSDFPEDSLELIVRDGRKEATYVFCSSYGEASARVVTDKRAYSYVVLTHSEGRGTNARTEYLSVLPIADPIVPIATFPVEGPAGMRSRWRYTHRTEAPLGGGLKFILSLRVLGELEPGDAVPREKARQVFVK